MAEIERGAHVSKVSVLQFWMAHYVSIDTPLLLDYL